MTYPAIDVRCVVRQSDPNTSGPLYEPVYSFSSRCPLCDRRIGDHVIDEQDPAQLKCPVKAGAL